MSKQRPSPDPLFLLRDFHDLCSVKSISLHGGTQIITADVNGFIKVWDLQSRRVTQRHKIEGKLTSVSNLGDFLVTQSNDGVKVWHSTKADLDFKEYDTQFEIGATFCRAQLFEYKDSIALYIPGLEQSSINVWNISTKRKIAFIQPDQKQGICLCAQIFSTIKNDYFMLIGYETGSILLWDIFMKKLVNFGKFHTESVTAFDFNTTLSIGVSGSVDNRIVFWKITDELFLQRVKVLEIVNPGINAVKIRQDGKICATGGWDHMVRIFSIKKMQPLAVLSYHREAVNCLQFTKCNLLLAGCADGQISVWDIYS